MRTRTTLHVLPPWTIDLRRRVTDVPLYLRARVQVRVGAQAACLCLLLPTLAVADPTGYYAEYKATYEGLPFSANAIRELRPIGDGRLKLSTSASIPLMTIEEESILRYRTGTLEPQRYRLRGSGLGARRKATIDFDWNALRASGEGRKDPWHLAIHDGVQDRLSYQLQLRLDMLASTDSQPPLVYQVADDGKIRTFKFVREGEEALPTPLGRLDTIRLSRLHRSPKRTTTLWLARDFQYLMARLLHVDDDDGFELVLEKAVLDGKEVTGD